MRHSELSEGIDVLDNNGNVVGSSKIAARHVSSFFSDSAHAGWLHRIFLYTLLVICKCDGGWKCIISCSAPVNQHPSDLMKEKIKLQYLKRSVCTMFSHFPPGNHGDRLHTCGSPDANLCAAPHHYVLPREVCTEIYCWLFFFLNNWYRLLIQNIFSIQLIIFWSVKCENMKNIHHKFPEPEVVSFMSCIVQTTVSWIIISFCFRQSTQYDKIGGSQFFWPPCESFNWGNVYVCLITLVAHSGCNLICFLYFNLRGLTLKLIS